jgi:hypothetical protein
MSPAIPGPLPVHVPLVEEDAEDPLSITLFGQRHVLNPEILRPRGKRKHPPKSTAPTWAEFSAYCRAEGEAQARREQEHGGQSARSRIAWYRALLLSVLMITSMAVSCAALLVDSANYSEIIDTQVQLQYVSPGCSPPADLGSDDTAIAPPAAPAHLAYLRLKSLEEAQDLRALREAEAEVMRFELLGPAANAVAATEIHRFARPIYLLLPPWLLRALTLGSFKVRLARVRVLLHAADDGGRCLPELASGVVPAIDYVASKQLGGPHGLTAIEGSKLRDGGSRPAIEYIAILGSPSLGAAARKSRDRVSALLLTSRVRSSVEQLATVGCQ